MDENRSPGVDATTVLTGYLCLLLAIPSSMVVGALGSAGAPSTILAVATFFLWLWFLVQRSGRDTGEPSPVRAAGLSWLLIMLVVYAHAMATPLPSDEISPADNGMLKLRRLGGDPPRGDRRDRQPGSISGPHPTVGDRRRARSPPWDFSSTPPRTSSSTASRFLASRRAVKVWELAERSGLTRPSGTSAHPIEYGVVLTMILPFAVVYAMHGRRHRWIYRGVLVVMGTTILLSISRSAMLCASVGLLVLSLT